MGALWLPPYPAFYQMTFVLRKVFMQVEHSAAIPRQRYKINMNLLKE